MKKNRIILSLLVLMGTLFLGACTDDPEPTPAPPTPEPAQLTLDSKSVEATAEGADFTIGYTIENPVEGEELALNCAAEWVINVSATETDICFTVAPNTLEEIRTATLTVTYGEQEDAIAITQAAYEAPKPFTIEIEEVKSTSCITNVKALDPNMWYVMYEVVTTYFSDYGITTAEGLFEDDKATYMNNAEFDGMNLGEYMEKYNAIFKGDTRAQWSNLVPGKNYVIYVYGIEFNDDRTDYTLVTDVAYEIITPTMAEIDEQITFDVDITISGPEITTNVTAQNWEGYYVVDYVDGGDSTFLEEGAEIDDEYTTQVALSWLKKCELYQMYGYTPSRIHEEFCKQGPLTETEELLSDTRYCAVVYAVSDVEGVSQVVSKPVVKQFSTERVEMSDMVLDIQVENIGSRIADITVTPSIVGEQYLFLLMPSNYIYSTEETDIINELLNDYSTYAYYFKDKMTSHITTLYDNTAYSIFCFGYYGGVPTTALFRYDFVTEKAVTADIQIEDIVIDGPYDPAALAAALPEQYGEYADYGSYNYIVSIETITDKPCPDIFHDVIDYYTYEYYAEYAPEIIPSDLLAFYHERIEIGLCEYGWEYVACSIAMDEKGNVSEMFVTEPFAYDESELKPIDELVEKLTASPETVSLRMVSKKDLRGSMVYHKPSQEKVTLKR